jgi:DNA-binding SARP family transcriptional activator
LTTGITDENIEDSPFRCGRRSNGVTPVGAENEAKQLYQPHTAIGKAGAGAWPTKAGQALPLLLWRERLFAVLPRLWNVRLALIVAPAGSGKTTLLNQLGMVGGAPVATYLAENNDSSVEAFLERLEALMTPTVPGLQGGWTTVDDAILALADAVERRTLLMIDDFHVLHETVAENACARLLEHLPPLVTMVIATRIRPSFNLPRLRASGQLVDVGGDDLRFRSWEVERLFRDVYREPLPPEALADLTRRTEGWAAGLQLFHLATQGKTAVQRRRTLAGLGARWDLVREYLAQNVLDDLPPDLRRFLLDTCLLTRLSGRLCDAFLATRDSAEILRELERRQVFTQAMSDGGYRYHEVLRAHLEAIFVETTGAAEAKARYRRAGEFLEAEDLPSDAVRAYCRAEAWEEVERLVGHGDERSLAGGADWVELLPSAIVREDPWLLLLAAREARAAGRLAEAIALYQDAERLFPSATASATCLRERLSLASWLQPLPQPTTDALGLLRQATAGDPLQAHRRAATLGGPEARLAGALATLLAGHARDAAALLAACADDPESSDGVAAAARIGLAAALLLAGDLTGLIEAERAAEEAERIGSPCFTRLARATLALGGGSDRTLEATTARVTSESEGDVWGSLVATFFEGWGALLAGEPAVELFEQAIGSARALGAGVVEAWARGAHSLAAARGGEPEARQTALQAEVSARIAGVKAAQGLAYLALSEGIDDAASEYGALARMIEEECGITLPVPRPKATGRPEAPPLEIRCFGRFALIIDGSPVDLSGLKPSARRLLRHLALFAGRPVHREVLIEALWPGRGADAATRHLHVLISTLRHVLEPGMRRGESRFIVRDGEAYLLSLPPDARVDVIDFERAVGEGRAARSQGQTERSVEAFQRALDLYTGDLLPEDGPAEWLLDHRDRRRAEACEAARSLAQALLERGQPLSAAVTCERGIYVDRYEDELWRLCVEAYERAGDAAAAERMRERYKRVLGELGLPAASH